jgi:hypothetical protein
MQTELQEAEVDIALNAGYMIASSQIDVSDSRELISNIVEWAKEFVQLDPQEWPADDYMEAIDQFAAQKLLDAYGVETVGL